MTALARILDGVTTSTPISEAAAERVRMEPLPLPELSKLKEPVWHRSVLQQVQEILALRDGWDGFNAGPIKNDVIEFSVRVLEDIMRPNTPAPHMTPMSHEGLMLEWHENGIDLEIEVERPGDLWVSFEDTVERIEEEKPLKSDLRTLAGPIEKLTKRSVLNK